MAKRKVKAAFPKEGVAKTITLPVKVKLLHDFDRYSNGSMMMTITDVQVKKDDKVMGNIRVDASGASIGCSIGRRMWSISVDQLWPLFEVADIQHLATGEER